MPMSNFKTEWIACFILFFFNKIFKNLPFHSIFKFGNKYSFTLGLCNPVCKKRQRHIHFLTGSTLSTNSKSPFIRDIRTQLPHGQVNQEGLDDSWENFNVYFYSLFLLKVL